MKGSFTAARTFGIPIRINVSWWVALALSTGLLGFKVYPDILPRSSSLVHWTLALVTSLVFFASVLLHELGHALVARAYGIPVRSITLFLLGGVAQISQEMKRPAEELLVAGVGPAVSILLSGIFLGLMLLSGDRRSPLGVMWTWLWLLNLSVGVFNMVPGFPMDGGRVLRALIWAATGSYRWATRIAGWCGRLVALLLIGLGLASSLRLPHIPLDAGPYNGLWFLLIGLYLDSGARQSLRMLRMLDYLRRYRAGDLMLRDVPVVDANTRVVDLLSEMLSSRESEVAFVTESGPPGENDRMIGMLARGRVIVVPPRDRDRLTARDLMLPVAGLLPAAPDDDAAGLLQRLELEELAGVPVVAGGEVLGLVARLSLLNLLERRGRV
jgi:Zn-dependent protease/CBS domain-containing protein